MECSGATGRGNSLVLGFCLAEAHSNSTTAFCSSKGPPYRVVNSTALSSLVNSSVVERRVQLAYLRLQSG